MLTFDYETIDYGLQQDLGPGWAWGDVFIIGMGYKIDGGPTKYTRSFRKMKQLLNDHDTWIAHNAQYEAGIGKMLLGDIKNKTIYCTKLLSKLHDQERFMMHSLDEVAQAYANSKKLSDTLHESALDLGLITVGKNYYLENKERESYKKALNKAKKDVWPILDSLDRACDAVEHYCIRDVDVTYDAFNALMELLPNKEVIIKWCRLINIATDMRAKGIRVDLPLAGRLKNEWQDKLLQAEDKFWNLCGKAVQWKSHKQLSTFLKERGYAPVHADDREEGGGFGKAFLALHNNDEMIKALSECRRWFKAIGFCDAIFKYEKNGRVYPELNILEARTGRFSCRNPNIQQIPKRDPEIGPAARALYLPEEGDIWCSGDFSNQEGRLTVHFAALLNNGKVKYHPSVYDRRQKKFTRSKEAILFESDSIQRLTEDYLKDPQLDMHMFNLNLIEEELGRALVDRAKDPNRKRARTIVKGIALGLMYGMGKAKLAGQLGVEEQEAQELKNAFNKGSPYISMLSDYAQWSMQRYGSIRSIGGRTLTVPSAYSYKTLNKLIQGSAADQTAYAMVSLYDDHDIVPICAVHDELNISVANENQAAVLKQIMENTVKLKIPSYTDLELGTDWSLGNYNKEEI